ncbi:DNA mismatch repair endonuclease MutL [Schlesneria paludicola]|uniref:DNA mismatch repair endonuclease MutL n=1 Tax=Schlesneria paludicola TaxID=360056 RepID=UPI00029A31BF|nr:DNA mismatch repair endonuclease MutL [Schlesneria paludicola]
MSRIQQLSTSVINKIAAGEVIERPASVIKELLENSVDALATRIEVDVVAGGSELIRIVDDGEGIHPDDLLLAVSSHATSKIRNADDLFGVQTMGFRGEALASVAEVSRLRIRSRQADAAHGHELVVNLGEVVPPRECGCPLGTQIEVRNLFENTPVRRKFLKTVSTEFGHISEHFTRVALANSRLHMVLRHNDKLVMELPASPKPLDRLRIFFGKDVADELIPVESDQGGVRMWGYVGHPNTSKATRKMQYLFLNGRWITDRSLFHALTEGYRGLLMVGRQPVCFLYIELPPDRVDVNVHPTKVEVRFQDSQQLFRQLLAMIRSKFLSMDLQSQLRLPATPAGGSGGAAPGLLSGFSPSPVRPIEKQRELQDEFSTYLTGQISPAPINPGSVGRNEPISNGSATAFAPAARPASVASARIEPWRSDTPDDTDNFMAPSAATAVAERLADPATSESETDVPAEPVTSAEFGPTEAAPAAEAPVQVAPINQNNAFRAMQVHDCYLIVETPEGVTVIDQHALHERIMYEHLRTRVLAGSVESQRLLVPQPIEVTSKEAAMLLEHRDSLERAGLGVEDFGNGTVIVNRYPAMLRKVDLQELVRDLIDKLESGGSAGVQSGARRDILDELLHMMSCKAAVKAGQRLSPEEIESLLMQRHLVDDAHHCPHGRPTALSLSRAELDRQFGRLG